MIPRVHAPDAHEGADILDVPDEEAHWLRDVLRRRVGEPVRVFDGRGREWDATVAASSKRGVGVALGARRDAVPEPRVAYTLAMPVLKADASDAVIRDAVMMGVVRIRPYVSSRTETTRATARRAGRQERWQRIAIASAKQCGRATVPTVDDVVAFETLVASTSGERRILFTEPSVDAQDQRLETVAPAAVLMATGPEGGWAAHEAAAARVAGWRAVTLGSRVLRADAAPLVALAVCQAVWGDL